MTPCDRIEREAAGLAALLPGDPEREKAWTHARACPRCERALHAAAGLQAALSAATRRPPLATPGVAAASGRIVSELRRENRRRILAAAVAVGAAFMLTTGFARYPSEPDADRGVPIALIGAALVSTVAAGARRWAHLVAAALPVLATATALMKSEGGAMQPVLGIECLLTELGCAALVVAGIWLAIRGGTSSLGPRAAAAGAAAGALAGMAALAIACPAHGARWHVVAFHATGVVVASGVAALAWYYARRTGGSDLLVR